MFALVVLGSTLAVLATVLLLHRLHRPKNYPPGPRWLPIIGNLLDVRRLVQKLGSQHAAFASLAEEYHTDVLGLRLGQDNVVVVQGYEAVSKVLKSDDFLGRPDNFFMRLRTMGARRGITVTDGPLWSEQRRFAVRHFRQLGYGKVHMEELIIAELKDFLGLLEPNAESGDPVSLGPLLPPSVLNVLWALTAGSRFARGDPRLKRLLGLLDERGRVFDMAGGALGTVPWLRHFAPEMTGYNLMNRLNASLKEMLEETIAMHYANYHQGRTRDLIDAYLHEIKARDSEESPSTFTDDQLAMVCLDMFLAGSYTTSSTLSFALMLMVLHPDIQSKCFHEIFNNVEKDRLPTLNDRPKLPYIEAVLMEVMRFYYVVPITGPRRVLKNTNLMGYNIPKDTVVLLNIHSVLNDKDHWTDPEVFRPERFLNKKGKFQPDDWLINFGLGKRRCLGDALARNYLFLFFAGTLQRYRLSAVPEAAPCRAPQPGLTLSPRAHEVLLTPRTALPGHPRGSPRLSRPASPPALVALGAGGAA